MARRIHRLVLALGLAAVTLGGAAAQMSPFGLSGFTLTDEDLRIIGEQAQPLYAFPPPPNGSSEKWNNPTSGNSGTMTLLESFEYEGLPCRKVQHEIKVKGVSTRFTYTLDRCRLENGQWKGL